MKTFNRSCPNSNKNSFPVARNINPTRYAVRISLQTNGIRLVVNIWLTKWLFLKKSQSREVNIISLLSQEGWRAIRNVVFLTTSLMLITGFHYCYSGEYVILANYYPSNSGQYKKHRENVLAVRRLKHNGLVTICRVKKLSICDMKYLLQKLSHTSSSSSIGNPSRTLFKVARKIVPYPNIGIKKKKNIGISEKYRRIGRKMANIGILKYRDFVNL